MYLLEKVSKNKEKTIFCFPENNNTIESLDYYFLVWGADGIE